MISIGYGEPGDSAGLAEAVSAVAKESQFLANTEGFSVEQTDAFLDFLKNSGGIQMVAKDEDRIVGWCDLSPGVFDGLTHVGSLGMGLLSGYRCKGIGKRLLLEIINVAFQKQFERIELEVFSTNVAAIALYQGVGFKIEGCKRKARKLAHAYEDILVYGLLREEWKG